MQCDGEIVGWDLSNEAACKELTGSLYLLIFEKL
jgi:hypothetical protein